MTSRRKVVEQTIKEHEIAIERKKREIKNLRSRLEIYKEELSGLVM